jgi:hypothetical protein
MSKFIPAATVYRETLKQVTRRLYIEKANRSEINRLQEVLKNKASISEELQSLGLTAKHAENLQDRLQLLNQAEEKIKGEEEPVVAPDMAEPVADVQPNENT